LKITNHSSGNTYQSIPGKEKYQEINRQQELVDQKGAKIERKNGSQFVIVTASKEIIKTNPDNNPPKSNTSHWVAATGSHTRPQSRFKL
jgi:hypothetical protein